MTQKKAKPEEKPKLPPSLKSYRRLAQQHQRKFTLSLATKAEVESLAESFNQMAQAFLAFRQEIYGRLQNLEFQKGGEDETKT